MSGVLRDERTDMVENTSYRLAYGFIAFALLLDVMYRSLVRQEAPWELLAMVIVGGMISTVYQVKYKVLTRESVRLIVLVSLFAGIVAALVSALRLVH